MAAVLTAEEPFRGLGNKFLSLLVVIGGLRPWKGKTTFPKVPHYFGRPRKNRMRKMGVVD
jgi:hypothetical protein